MSADDKRQQRKEDRRRAAFRLEPMAPIVDALLRGAPGARRGRGLAALKREWASVAGPDFKDIAAPDRFDPPRKGRPGVLVLRAHPGAALLLQHEGPRLVERVNAFLGAEAIGRVRIAAGAPPPPQPERRLPPRPLADDDPRAEALARRARTMASPDLAAALTRLGRAVAAEADARRKR